jgi:hypothetical protein
VAWSLAAVALVVGGSVLVELGPTRCPVCRRRNLFRRARTGRCLDEADEEGVLRRRSVELVCGRCQARYWLVRDDYEGVWASVSPPAGG